MDSENKIIDFLIAHKNNLWTTLIVLVGGLSGLFLSIPFSKAAFSQNMYPRLLLFALGLFFVFVMIKGLMTVHYEIIQKLKDKRSRQ